MYVRGWMAHALRNVWSPEDSTGSPRTGVPGGCEPSSMGSKTQAGPHR